jgi:NAD(P)-dependent dehydrogenase (short-subunit alcohol dehydrogenase family)
MTVSVVTGAGSGIGAAAVAELAARGDAVVCIDLDREAAERTASGFTNAIAVGADVVDEDQVATAVATGLQRFGDIHNVITCAGVELGGHTLDLDVGEFRKVLDVNVTGSFLVAREGARAMVERGHGGAIVLIGSIASYMSFPRSAPYSASKGGVLGLGRALAVDLAGHGIRVNTVGPGVADTPMSAASLADPQKSEQYMARIPLRRPADPAEIARVAVFLTSEAASYVTGAFVPADGGWLAG